MYLQIVLSLMDHVGVGQINKFLINTGNQNIYFDSSSL